MSMRAYLLESFMKEREANLDFNSTDDRLPMKREDPCFALLQSKLDSTVNRNRQLEKENEQLKQEILHLKSQIAMLRAQESDRRSMFLKKVKSSISSNSLPLEKQIVHNIGGEGLAVDIPFSRPEISLGTLKAIKKRVPRVPKPPPRPSACLTLTPKASGKEAQLPPPPPPPPLKRQGGSHNTMRRMPEVVELYRALTRRDGKPETRTSSLGMPVITNAREMIGEIQNRSTYQLAIKSDVETQGEFINFLKKEVENAAFTEISDVEAFVKWVDEELSYLVDERAVLKHFPQWPERKADAMREAAFAYRDLKNLESEVSSFQDDIRQSVLTALKRIQALQDKLERSVHNIEKLRESTRTRYRDFQIPLEWMLDTGFIAQLKLGSMKLVKLHMNRVVTAMQSDGPSEDEDLMLQSVRFAFRVHQFVGGFDEESKHAFQELRKMASRCYL